MNRRLAEQWLLIGLVAIAISLFGVGCPKRSDVPPPDEMAEEPDPGPAVEEVTESPVVEESPAMTEAAPIELMDIYYDFDKYTIKAEMRSVLNANFAALQAEPDAEILIEGHCDERGTVEYNLALGQKRANSARDYMISLGMSASQVSTISYGEEMPQAAGHNEAAWAQNRRAHMLILKK